MRKFDREPVYSVCAILLDDRPVKSMMINFSKMGVMITTTVLLKPKRFISLIYRNEKNEYLQILTYVAHSTRNDRYFVAGLQFIGLESRSGR